VDITDRKKAEQELREAHDDLEKKVKERTKALENKNIALSEVLATITEEKQKIRREIATSVEQVVIPIAMKLKRFVPPEGNILINVLENSLNELIYASLDVLALYSKLSPREIEVCNMVKNGLTSKEISSELNISDTTVQKHRQQIRKKLGITNDKVNMRSYLLNLP
jgi:DNA-binding NarL/FixJ family response regulator